MTTLNLKASSNITLARYNSSTQDLVVEFKPGSSYVYRGVPQVIVDSWVAVSNEPKGSTGSAFSALIKKGGFKYEKLVG